MSTKTIIEYTDDLDGSRGAETVRFSLDGTLYEIDLKGAHAKKFRKAVAPYAAVARPGAQQAGAKRSTAAREHSREVRSWARGHGYEVGDKGRIPAEVQQAYTAALRNTRTLA